MMAEAKNAPQVAKPRSRGRQPSKVSPAQVDIIAPGARRTPPPSPNKDEVTEEEKRKIKEARIEQLTESIVNDLNDHIMTLAISIGVPSNFLYKPGMEPARVAQDSKFTDVAGNICISPMQAGVYARFIAELERTSVGQKVSGTTSSGSFPMFLYGALSIALTAQYLSGLQKFYNQLKPLLDAYQAQEALRQRDAEAKKQQENQSQESDIWKANGGL